MTKESSLSFHKHLNKTLWRIT